MLLYGMLVVFFAYFYTAIQFDPYRRPTTSASTAGSSRASGPGTPTAEYLNDILVRITLPGSLFLAASPCSRRSSWRSGIPQFPFGGTAILITVGVALETMKQLESQLMMRHYEGFLR